MARSVRKMGFFISTPEQTARAMAILSQELSGTKSDSRAEQQELWGGERGLKARSEREAASTLASGGHPPLARDVVEAYFPVEIRQKSLLQDRGCALQNRRFENHSGRFIATSELLLFLSL